MRTPVYRIDCDDDPNDYDYPCAATLEQLGEGMGADEFIETRNLNVGEQVAIGGGAAPAFTITRIR